VAWDLFHQGQNPTLSRAEPDICMCQVGIHYEYVAVYVDNLAIAWKAPRLSLTLTLMNHHGLQAQGHQSY